MAGWRREKLPLLPRKAALDLARDWICEVLSISTAASDRFWTLPLYFQAGVGQVWLVNPVLRTLEVFGRNATTWIVLGTYGEQHQTVRAEPCESVELPLGALWPELEGE